MSIAQRIRIVLWNLFVIGCAIAMALNPNEGYEVISVLLCVTLVLEGLGRIIFYLFMARHMVGGKRSLYGGIIICDLGIFVGSLSRLPLGYVMLYLLIGHLLSGVILILRAREAKGLGANWKPSFIQGVIDILIVIACIVFRSSPRTAVYIYCAGLIYSSVVKLASAFSRTSVVYIPEP